MHDFYLYTSFVTSNFLIVNKIQQRRAT